jgi:hypothetical protein
MRFKGLNAISTRRLRFAAPFFKIKERSSGPDTAASGFTRALTYIVKEIP